MAVGWKTIFSCFLISLSIIKDIYYKFFRVFNISKNFTFPSWSFQFVFFSVSLLIIAYLVPAVSHKINSRLFVFRACVCVQCVSSICIFIFIIFFFIEKKRIQLMVNERMETIPSFFYSVHPIDVSFTFQSLKTSSQLQQPLLLTDRSGYTLFFWSIGPCPNCFRSFLLNTSHHFFS